MSRMSDLWIDIEYLLEHTDDVNRVAQDLNVPVEWVISVADSMIREYIPIAEAPHEELK